MDLAIVQGMSTLHRNFAAEAPSLEDYTARAISHHIVWYANRGTPYTVRNDIRRALATYPELTISYRAIEAIGREMRHGR